MKSGRLTNTLLALIFLALVAHLVVPMLAAQEAKAVNSDAIAPASIAAGAGFPALDKVASEIGGGLKEIARSNQQIASAIREHASSSDRIAQSLEGVATRIKSLERSAPAPARARTSEPVEEEELEEGWWQGQIPE